MQPFGIVPFFKNHLTVCIHQNFFPRTKRRSLLILKYKIKFSLHHWQIFPSRNMATLRNKKKLAAVSRETPECSRGSRGQNVLDPELTKEYISQVSEEIEGRVTKKLSKEFSKTESRILGALWKLDKFLLNRQVRTCSVALQGTSGNAISENRKTHGDRSSNDPYPEVGFFLTTLVNSKAQRQKPTRIWWPKPTLTTRLINAETGMISPGNFKVPWICAEQRWKPSNLWNTEYIWHFNSGKLMWKNTIIPDSIY